MLCHANLNSSLKSHSFENNDYEYFCPKYINFDQNAKYLNKNTDIQKNIYIAEGSFIFNKRIKIYKKKIIIKILQQTRYFKFRVTCRGVRMEKSYRDTKENMTNEKA